MFLTAEQRFRRLDAHPDVAKDSQLNLQRWDALESLYEREKALWRMFVGSQPTTADNKLYARFRELSAEGQQPQGERHRRGLLTPKASPS